MSEARCLAAALLVVLAVPSAAPANPADTAAVRVQADATYPHAPMIPRAPTMRGPKWTDCTGEPAVPIDCAETAQKLTMGRFDTRNDPELAACALEWWRHDAGSAGDAGTLRGDARLIRFALVTRRLPIPSGFPAPAVGRTNRNGPPRDIYQVANMLLSVRLDGGNGIVEALVLRPGASDREAAACHDLFVRRNKLEHRSMPVLRKDPPRGTF